MIKNLPVIKKCIRDKKGSKTPPAFMLPNTDAAFKMLVSSGTEFSTATVPGLLQAYIRRGPSHYREPFSNQDAITAGYQNEALNPLLLDALAVAASAENIQEICQHVLELMNTDPAKVREYVELASTYSWTAAHNADRLAVDIGKLALAIAD